MSLIRSLHHDAAPIHETGHQLLQTGRLFREGQEAPHFGSGRRADEGGPEGQPLAAVRRVTPRPDRQHGSRGCRTVRRPGCWERPMTHSSSMPIRPRIVTTRDISSTRPSASWTRRPGRRHPPRPPWRDRRGGPSTSVPSVPRCATPNGRNSFGQSCLLAAATGGGGGACGHGQHVRDGFQPGHVGLPRLAPPSARSTTMPGRSWPTLDHALSALLDDLDRRGYSSRTTLVVATGEVRPFAPGSTPNGGAATLAGRPGAP